MEHEKIIPVCPNCSGDVVEKKVEKLARADAMRWCLRQRQAYAQNPASATIQKRPMRSAED